MSKEYPDKKEQAEKVNCSIQLTRAEKAEIEAILEKEFPLGSLSAVIAYGVREWLARRKATR